MTTVSRSASQHQQNYSHYVNLSEDQLQATPLMKRAILGGEMGFLMKRVMLFSYARTFSDNTIAVLSAVRVS